MSTTPYFIDRVLETSTTTGTGTYTLAGAVTGFQAFSVVGDGKSCYYTAESVDGSGIPNGGWEVGIGTYTLSGTTLSRDTILSSSNSGSAVSWSAGTRRIFLDLPAAQLPSLDGVIGALLSRASYPRIFGSNLSTGDNDLYTVPTGRRAIIIGQEYYNPSAGTILAIVQFKSGGTYYRAQASATSLSTLTASTQTKFIVLEAGEIYSINTATTNGLNVFGTVVEFDASSPVKGIKFIGLSNGDNTVYTCPAGKTFIPIATSGIGGFSSAFQVDSGGTRTFYFNNVPSGGSASSTNRVTVATSLAGPNQLVSIQLGNLNAGDFYSVNVDVGAATQYFMALGIER